MKNYQNKNPLDKIVFFHSLGSSKEYTFWVYNYHIIRLLAFIRW